MDSIEIEMEQKLIEESNTPPNVKEYSLDDTHRIEMMWDLKNSGLIQKWADDARKQSKLHGICARKNKHKFVVISIPTMVVPVLVGSLNSYLSDYQIIQCLLMLCSGFLSVIQTIFNYGKKSEKHFSFESLYGELANQIDAELIKGKKHRQQADVFLEHTLNRVNALNGSAPPT